MSKEILCTLGPASLNERVVSRLEELGVNLFRINLSHTRLEDLEAVIQKIRGYTRVPICLDSEGAQIRTGYLSGGSVEVGEHALVGISRKPVPGDKHELNFYPAEVIEQLEEGDMISIDFDSVLVQVVAKEKDRVVVRVLNGGKIGQNKAVTVERGIRLETLTQKDRGAMEIGKRMGIRHVALSFANRAEDVDLMRSVCAKDVFLISKIECRNGLFNLEAITAKSDAILIDRGDLSREEPIERIPWLQKKIIHVAKKQRKKVYVATNLLESMISNLSPTRAEVNDVINTLIDGADGLVLAAETAIGKDPVSCAQMIVRLTHEYERGLDVSGAYYPVSPKSLLVEPHGGRLVERVISPENSDKTKKRRSLAVGDTDLMDCEQIALGAYSPLEGFMGEETLTSVLEKSRLPDGTVWTMPVILQRTELPGDFGVGDTVGLTNDRGALHAVLEISQIYTIYLKKTARQWFGTDSSSHPGVVDFLKRGPHVLAGKVTLVRRLEVPHSRYLLTPAQARFVFSHKGWNRVVGFHTRNVAHRAHEYIQLSALESTRADGLLISPLVGTSRRGDFLPELIIKSYQSLIASGFYPAGKVVIGSLLTYPRFSGPREAVFTALCRKNMGCSHFIVGRNHSGVGDFYKDEDTRLWFDKLGPLGITPVFFDTVGYDERAKEYAAGVPSDKTLKTISGTEIRRTLKTGGKLPDWFMRSAVQEMLQAELAAKRPVFHE
ncbi:MAG: sulfate adenylyltransferase [Candidatus Omnitrophica bacterium]|nr:sulfate adenylyltransferase [Candidatus Omnitrophota bacterium]